MSLADMSRMSLADIARGVHVPVPRTVAHPQQQQPIMQQPIANGVMPPTGASAAADPEASATGPKFYHGTVKSIMSGDTLVIRGQPNGNKRPIERILSLAYLQAPRLGRRPRQGEESVEVDEPGAFEAREFLRKVLVGREVKFYIEYSIPSREYGDIIFSNDSVAKHVVSNGHARVRTRSQQNDTTGLYARLLEYQKIAEEKKYGIFAEVLPPVRSVKWSVDTNDLRSFCEAHQGNAINAIVESVRDSTTFNLILLNEQHTHIRLSLSGVKGDGFRWEGNKEIPDGVFSEEGRFFCDARVLQRNVKVIIEGVSNNMLYGTITHHKGFNMAEILLREGFVRVVDWSLAKVANPDSYRHAEGLAKNRSLRMWSNYDESAESSSSVGQRLTVTVVDIVNGETFRGKTSTGEVQRFALSSIRQPRVGGAPSRQQSRTVAADSVEKEAGSGSESPVNSAPAAAGANFKRKSMYDTPYMFEAKEYLRTKLVGKTVNAVIDYEQPARDGYPLKICVTVRGSDGLNLAEQMVLRGLATVQQHGRNDERRSSCYDDLLVAESKAQTQGKGVHSTKPYKPVVVDVSNDKIKNASHFNSLQRAGRLPAVVDHVVHGGRVKVFIPKEGIITTLLIAGIVVPRQGRGKGESEPFADEAAEYTKSKLLQQNVEITVDGQDKPGNYIGSLTFNGINHSLDLVTLGLASCHPTAEKLSFGREMRAAELAAKDAKLKIWENYVEAKPEPEEPEEREVKHKEVVVTEVASATELYVQYTGQSEALQTLMSEVAAHFVANPPTTGAYTPKKNELCCAKFAADGQWYRAKVLSGSGDSTEVRYIDFGNTETVTADAITAIPSQFSSKAAFAKRVAMAFVQLSDEEEWVEEAGEVLQEEIINRVYSVNTEYTVDDVEYVTLADGDQDVTSALISEGLVFAAERREKRLRQLSSKYQKVEEEARDAHVGMWRYGDCRNFGDNEAKEFGAPKPETDAKNTDAKKK